MNTLLNRNHNYIVAPIYYEGTAFEDIIRCLKYCIVVNNLNIKFLKTPLASENILYENFDDKRYFQSQLSSISEVMKVLNQDSRILFLDFFNPGFDVINYFCQLNNIVPKFGCLIHGSAFLNGDSYSWDWLKQYELGWFNTYDSIFCPSEFLKKELDIFKTKTKVFPFGIDGVKFPKFKPNRQFDVVFPHRLEIDKGVDEFIEIVNEMDEVNFLITCPQEESVISKNIYYAQLKKKDNVYFTYSQKYTQHLNSLADCKIVLSCARQENFGYSVLKSSRSGAIPIVPNRLCYPEMYNQVNLYGTKEECILKIRAILNDNNYISSKTNYGLNYSFLPLLLDFFE